jgi:hypothetical protein
MQEELYGNRRAKNSKTKSSAFKTLDHQFDDRRMIRQERIDKESGIENRMKMRHNFP